jgi:hypothetical protein
MVHVVFCTQPDVLRLGEQLFTSNGPSQPSRLPLIRQWCDGGSQFDFFLGGVRRVQCH